MMKWMFTPYARYFDFSGRSRRMEFWMFFLLWVFVYIGFYAMILSMVPWTEAARAAGPQEPGAGFFAGTGFLGLFMLLSFIPLIAVQVRRFHDQDRSGWMFLLNFLPFGSFAVLVFMFLEGTKGPNKYGADPKDPTGASVFE